MVVGIRRRLAGFRFENQSPPLTDVLPRMDVAAFVGFAASGPLHRPVVVEDTTQFAMIFGDDVPLAWDQQRGEQVYGYLAPAVRAFFRNGGRRCWIVRVAGEQAQYNNFPLPGLASVGGEIVPAFARARAQGSWSDELQASTALLSLPVIVNGVSLADPMVDLTLTSAGDVTVGDLLRLTFRTEGYVVLFAVQAVAPIGSGAIDVSPGAGMDLSRVHVTGKAAMWFSIEPPASPIPSQAVMFTYGDQKTVGVQGFTISDDKQEVSFVLASTGADAPAPGSFVRFDFEVGQFLVAVQSVDVTYEDSSLPAEMIRVTGQGVMWLKSAPPVLPTSPPAGERLTFEMWTRQQDSYPVHLSDLAFDMEHPRFWGALPTDEQLYAVTQPPSSAAPINLWQAVPQKLAYTALWQEASTPRFPVAGLEGTADMFYVPVSMPTIPEQYLGAARSFAGQPAPALVRDGLGEFSSDLFLDGALAGTRMADLLAQADYFRYQVPDPQQLQGIYAALNIEEVTLIAVPDAVQRGWDRSDVENTYTQHLPGAAAPPATEAPQHSIFSACNRKSIKAPDLDTIGMPDEHGTFTLTWSTTVAADGPAAGKVQVNYVVEEATEPDFGDSVSIYRGDENPFTVYGRSAGDYYYHVRAEVDGVSSDWSATLLVHIAPAWRWRLKTSSEYSADTLIAIQRAACGDRCAMLTLPEHYREDEVVTHVGRLKAVSDPLTETLAAVVTSDVPPLGFGETLAFSYGVLYHPWLLTSEEVQPDEVKRLPPEGAICGMAAQRAITRGAWVAPANVPLQGVVGLTPQIGRGSWLRLLEAKFNLVRQEPRGFLSLSSDTLSDDEDLRPLNVRRLLILLRRLALRLGTAYVFEPNDSALKRLVQRGFEDMLGQMFTRGAFVGDTPEDAFQVVTDDGLNTAQDADQGRFIVELRVAPSQPMTFFTVRLVVQSSGNEVITEVL